jgi:hypothetical protein
MCASRPGKKVKRAQFTCHRAISVTILWQSRVDYRTHQNGKEQKGTKSNDDGTKSNDNEFTETLEHLLKLLQHFTETLKSLVCPVVRCEALLPPELPVFCGEEDEAGPISGFRNIFEKFPLSAPAASV